MQMKMENENYSKNLLRIFQLNASNFRHKTQFQIVIKSNGIVSSENAALVSK